MLSDSNSSIADRKNLSINEASDEDDYEVAHHATDNSRLSQHSFFQDKEDDPLDETNKSTDLLESAMDQSFDLFALGSRKLLDMPGRNESKVNIEDDYIGPAGAIRN